MSNPYKKYSLLFEKKLVFQNQEIHIAEETIKSENPGNVEFPEDKITPETGPKKISDLRDKQRYEAARMGKEVGDLLLIGDTKGRAKIRDRANKLLEKEGPGDIGTLKDDLSYAAQADVNDPEKTKQAHKNLLEDIHKIERIRKVA